jgi:protein involved in polysaccharide export with SLBB domain
MPMIRSLATSSPPSRRRAALRVAALSLGVALCVAATTAFAQFDGNVGNDLTTQGDTGNNTPSASAPSNNNDTGNGSTQLRQSGSNGTRNRQGDQPEPRDSNERRQPYKPSEFERYVQQRAEALRSQGQGAQQGDGDDLDSQQTSASVNGNGSGNGSGNGNANANNIRQRNDVIRRFGANLMTDAWQASVTQDPLPAVPGDYIIRAGDEIQLTVWGSADANLRLTVDRSGNISVPRVGSITVAGLRNADLPDAIRRRVGETFKNFQLTATMGQVRAIRVFVGGYAQRPGSLVVSGLSSVLHALMRAGGPSAAGSFRDIHLRRNGKEVAVFDLYDLLLRGDRNTDQLVQPDDIIFIGPIGTQVAMLGSVNQQAIYELKPGESLVDVLGMAGGFNAVADRRRVAIERLADRNTGRVTELALPAHAHDALDTGDLVLAYSAVTLALPQGNQNEHVRVEGEVAHPGEYILPPGSRMSDAIRLAGGMTAAAYPYGTEFMRDSVRRTQQVNYERALRDLETDMTKNQANQRVTSSEELAAQSATATASGRLLERLRQVRPTGRVVLQLPPDATTLPDLALEDGDTVHIPNRGSSVGIFGSVFNAGNFVFEPGHTTEQYLAQAGGPTRGADKSSVFMLRANGSVISAQQGASFWHSSSDFSDAVVQPGDTIFVPEQVSKATFVQDAKDWTQILYQFGLGLAGIKTLGL